MAPRRHRRHRDPARRQPHADGADPPRRAVRGHAAAWGRHRCRRGRRRRLRAGGHLRGRHLPGRRPLPVLAHAGRPRPPPVRRGPPRDAVAGHGRPCPRAPGRDGGVVRGVGPVGPGAAGGRRLQRLGRPHPPHAHARGVRRVGAVRPRGRGRPALQVRDRRGRRLADPQDRPLRLRHRGAAGHRRHRRHRGHPRVGRPAWMEQRAATDAMASPMSVYECTWARGGGCRRRATGRSPTGSWPSSSPSTWSTWASPTWSCCRWPSIRSPGRGATRSPPTTRPRPASARPTTSGSWSTPCTPGASA